MRQTTEPPLLTQDQYREFIKNIRFPIIKATLNYGCWRWKDAYNDGYGSFYDKETQRTYPAHRLSYRYHIGLIGENKIIRHKCNNRECVNPKHLISGTDKENMTDQISNSGNRKGHWW